MSKSEGKPVTLICIDSCKIDGRHVARGEILPDVEPDLAKELTGAGRTRLAAPEEIAAARKGKAKTESAQV